MGNQEEEEEEEGTKEDAAVKSDMEEEREEESNAAPMFAKEDADADRDIPISCERRGIRLGNRSGRLTMLSSIRPVEGLKMIAPHSTDSTFPNDKLCMMLPTIATLSVLLRSVFNWGGMNKVRFCVIEDNNLRIFGPNTHLPC